VSPRLPDPAQPVRVLHGIMLLARGRAAGLAAFGDTRQAFLSSLAPLLAFPLVASLLMLLRGSGAVALTDLLATLAVLLAPAVVSFELARLWRRESDWLRFATAFNWCQWALPIVAALLMLVLATSILLGMPSEAAAALVVTALVGYGLWLHWFLVRHGLRVSRLRAVLIVLAMNAATSIVVLVLPHLALILSGGGAE
jgi:hypothetical protein